MTKPQTQGMASRQQQDLPCIESHSVVPLMAKKQLLDAQQIIHQEADALNRLATLIDDRFCDAVQMIQHTSGCVVVTGVGKAGLIGQKIVATLSSTGTRSFFLHPTEAMHGDLGCLAAEDLVLAISNSGRSEEVLKLVPILDRRGIPLIAMTRDDQSQLAKAATVVLEIGCHSEAGDLKLAPSVSTTAMLALGDALALVVSQAKGFGKSDFAESHPAGNLGRQFQPVVEVMRTEAELRTACEHETVRSVMVNRSPSGRRTGAVLLTDEAGRLSGIFTDSDLARLFEKRQDHFMDHPIRQVMSVNPTTIHEQAMLPEAVSVMKQSKISELPVINDLGAPVGLVDITDVIDVVPVARSVKSDSAATQPAVTLGDVRAA